MQTFLPLPSFAESVQVLDNVRLRNQRNEVLVILRALVQGPYKNTKPCCRYDGVAFKIANKIYCSRCGDRLLKTPWYNHPATQMWKGHEHHLATYGILCCKECVKRGFKDTLQGIFKEYRQEFLTNWPKWFGDERFHASHRSNLLRKDSQHYGQFGWKELDNLPYFWPTKNEY